MPFKNWEQFENFFAFVTNVRTTVPHLYWYPSQISILIKFWGKGQNLERRNSERPIFRNLKIENIKITKHELFQDFIFEFVFFHFFKIGRGRNFERPIIRNSKMANVKSNGRYSYSIFLFTQFFAFFIFFNYLNTQILVFLQF